MTSPRRNVRRLAGQVFGAGFVLLCFAGPSPYSQDPDPTPTAAHEQEHQGDAHETTGGITIITRR